LGLVKVGEKGEVKSGAMGENVVADNGVWWPVVAVSGVWWWLVVSEMLDV
jgi:hypothetical protein